MPTNTYDASQATIYQWIKNSVNIVILPRATIDEDGNHYTVYEMSLKYIDIHPDNGDVESYVTRHEDAADQPSHIWDDLHGGKR